MSAPAPRRKRKGADELKDLKASLNAVEASLRSAAEAAPEGPLHPAVREAVTALPILHRCAPPFPLPCLRVGVRCGAVCNVGAGGEGAPPEGRAQHRQG